MTEEEIVFPCTFCGGQNHAVQAHGYYPFMGHERSPSRYRLAEVDSPKEPSPTSEEEGWLPDDYVLKLTALELGALRGFLESARAVPALNTFRVFVKGRTGSIPMIERLLEKIEQETRRHG